MAKRDSATGFSTRFLRKDFSGRFSEKILQQRISDKKAGHSTISFQVKGLTKDAHQKLFAFAEKLSNCLTRLLYLVASVFEFGMLGKEEDYSLKSELYMLGHFPSIGNCLLVTY